MALPNACHVVKPNHPYTHRAKNIATSKGKKHS